MFIFRKYIFIFFVFFNGNTYINTKYKLKKYLFRVFYTRPKYLYIDYNIVLYFPEKVNIFTCIIQTVNTKYVIEQFYIYSVSTTI